MFLFKAIIPNLVFPHSAFCYKGIMSVKLRVTEKLSY